MFHEPSLPASTWPIGTATAPPLGVANRVTCDNGSEVPKKSGCLTLVMSSVFETPLSLAGLSWPVRTIGPVGDGGGVGDGQPGATRVRRRTPGSGRFRRPPLTPASA